MSLTLTQGASRTIRVTGIVDATGAPLDVTGWSVVAQIRTRPGGPLLAEWVTGTPTSGQGQALADSTGIALAVPYAMSSAWTWTFASLHVEVTEPGLLRRERFSESLYLDPELIP